MKFENIESSKPKLLNSQNKLKLTAASLLHMGSNNEVKDQV